MISANNVHYHLHANGVKAATGNYVNFTKPTEMPDLLYTSYRIVEGTTYALATNSYIGVTIYVDTTSRLSPTFSSDISDNTTISGLSVRIFYEF